ncbi:adenylate/guanylate cyclase domain-containing protein, partial [Aquiflexum sp.]|uniref:adenylate/guanylate cyclase domain-containing protein n=1 Tax=Aquiflexum sp. TaxID=1872584 RepID=UPI003593BD4F
MKEDLKKTKAAILFSDIVGYTALMGDNQDLAFELVNKNLKIHQDILAKNNGKLIKELGDGILCSFTDSHDAVAAAYELQKHYFNSKELNLRIGIHYGEVILDRNDVFGDAVNIASRLQTLGLPGSVLFSKKIQEGIGEPSIFKLVSKGLFKLKNVKEPIEIYALANEGLKIPKRGEMLKLLESRLKKFMVAAVIFLAVSLIGFLIYHNSYIKQFTETEIKSIAVLPFSQVNEGDDDIRFSDGLTLDLISHLSPISTLRIISKSSSETYKDSNESLDLIAENLQVQFLLYGDLENSKDSIFVHAELYDSHIKEIIWQGFLKSERENFFQIYTQILKNVVSEIGLKLTPEETIQLEKLYTKNISAFDYYLLGREYFYKYNIHLNQF